MKLPLPQSLNAQFALVALCLAALVVALGATTIYSLSSSADAIRELAEARLAHQEDAHHLVQRTLTIERLALQLSSDVTVDAAHETQRHIVEELTSFDRLVDRLAASNGSVGVGVDALALHRSSQLFRNTVNIAAQVRESVLSAAGTPASELRQRAALASLNENLRRQADVLAVAARQQSDYFTRDYRDAVRNLAEHSERTRRWVVGEVAVSLLLAWLIAREFLGRHVVARLRRVSHALRHGDVERARTGIPVYGGDEIADMARAVEQFLEDRRQRRQAEDALKGLNAELEARVAQRTLELSHALADREAEIVERQRAEDAARASEHFLNSIIENIPDTIFVKDAATLCFVRFNKAGEQLLGYRREELIGKAVHDLFPVQEADFFVAKDRAVLASRQMVDVQEEPVHTRHGLRVVHTMKIPILDVHGEPRFLLGISRDITEQKRAEAELRDSARRYREIQMALAHANRVTAMGQLLASIAHEIRQPIGANATNAQAGLRWLSAQPPALEAAARAFGRIVKDAMRASEVIDRIRGLIKNAPSRMERLQVNDAILEVVELTRGEADEHRVQVRTQLAQDLPLVDGDRIQLQQVTLNLVLNAIEAMSEAEQASRELIIASGKDASGGVLISVQDSGPGVAAESAERLFEPFYTTKSGGMGMGLTICRSIVEAHGGRLWVAESGPHGAAFQFTVPVLAVADSLSADAVK